MRPLIALVFVFWPIIAPAEIIRMDFNGPFEQDGTPQKINSFLEFQYYNGYPFSRPLGIEIHDDGGADDYLGNWFDGGFILIRSIEEKRVFKPVAVAVTESRVSKANSDYQGPLVYPDYFNVVSFEGQFRDVRRVPFSLSNRNLGGTQPISMGFVDFLMIRVDKKSEQVFEKLCDAGVVNGLETYCGWYFQVHLDDLDLEVARIPLPDGLLMAISAFGVAGVALRRRRSD